MTDCAELTYSKQTYFEAAANDGSIDNITKPLYIDLTNGTFSGFDGDDFAASGKITVANLSLGLQAVITRLSDTRLKANLTGNALSHTNADDVEDLTFSFNDSAFNSLEASEVIGSFRDDLVIDFEDTPGPQMILSGNTVKLEDLNGDGLLDLVTGKRGSTDDRVVRYYINDGTDEPFKVANAQEIVKSPGYTYKLVTGDIDQDGLTDLVVASGGRTQYYLNNGTDLPFEGVIPSARIDEGQPYGSLLADLDGDNYPELIVDNRIYFNDPASPGFEGVTPFTFPDAGIAWSWDVAAEDINGDGFVDLVFANMGDGGTGSTNRNHYYLNNGTSAPFEDVTPFYFAGPAARTDAVEIADMNGDGLLDVIFGNTTENASKLFLNSGNTADPFEGVEGQPFAEGITWTVGLKIADLDNDGDNDIIIANTASLAYGAYAIDYYFLNNGSPDAPFVGATGIVYEDRCSETSKRIHALDVGDINNDGKIDIVTANNEYEVIIYLEVISGSE
ncbi:MAG: VCBS repeat-containing protein [Anaerolineales bacterium]|nr:VCBS repeat-containing protein [Anaerolineales bacterium]